MVKRDRVRFKTAINWHRHGAGGFKTCGQPASPNEGAGFKKSDQPGWPHLKVINRGSHNEAGAFKKSQS